MGSTGTIHKHLHLSYYKPNVTSYSSKTASNPLLFIEGEGNAYPTNTKITGWFNEDYAKYKGFEKYSKYYHEGIDFSGQTANLLPNWQFGLMGEVTKLQAKRSKYLLDNIIVNRYIIK